MCLARCVTNVALHVPKCGNGVKKMAASLVGWMKFSIFA